MSQQSVYAPLNCTQHSLSSNKPLVCHAQTPLLMQSPTHNQLFCDDACGEDQQESRMWHSEIVVRIHALALPGCSPRRGHLRGGIVLGFLLRGIRVC